MGALYANSSQSIFRILSVLSRLEIYIIFTGTLMLVSLYLSLLWAPTEANQGHVQRIMYMHVPLALSSLASFGTLFIASVMYLVRRTSAWDALGHSAAEVGLLLLSLTIVTGPIWAKAVWNTWWNWEPLLTTTVILWLMAVAYLMLRSYAPTGQRGSRLSAVLGCFAGLAAPFVYFAVELFGRLLHPAKVVGPARSDDSAIAATIGITLLIAIVAIASLSICLVRKRYLIRRSEDEVESLYALALQIPE